ncbi:MAG: hypothetical protein RML72_08990 [Bacteroidia bacterium]|nr:hypothetical protein [Bacteroidia bacterium]MDW8158991.1 hypothetical protein [Bacteroidia bacterium]
MLTIPKIIIIVLFVIVGTAISCEDSSEPKELPPPETLYDVAPEAEPGTGHLQVYVFKLAGRKYRPVPNAEVAVYLSFHDFERKVPLDFGVTNPNGNINFGSLNVGNYYIETTLFENNLPPRSRLLVAQVQNKRLVTKNFVFE